MLSYYDSRTEGLKDRIRQRAPISLGVELGCCNDYGFSDKTVLKTYVKKWLVKGYCVS